MPGTVEVDGVPVTVEQRRSYRRLFGYVPQSVYLLDDTVTRNIALGLPDEEIDLESVRRACALAQIAQFVEDELPERIPDGGGRARRAALGRSAPAHRHRPRPVPPPPVLVFDEATSALDVHTERQLFGALEAIARSHTVVTIAHRLETVAKSDVVVVLDRGRVVDRGSPEEVLKRYRLADVAGPATAVGVGRPGVGPGRGRWIRNPRRAPRPRGMWKVERGTAHRRSCGRTRPSRVRHRGGVRQPPRRPRGRQGDGAVREARRRRRHQVPAPPPGRGDAAGRAYVDQLRRAPVRVPEASRADARRPRRAPALLRRGRHPLPVHALLVEGGTGARRHRRRGVQDRLRRDDRRAHARPNRRRWASRCSCRPG